MKIFNIPSWYPSVNNPIYGTFVKEQIEMLARYNPDWKMGISTWGQGDPDYELRAKDHVLNISKIFKQKRQFRFEKLENQYLYNTPQFIWTRRFRKGNLDHLISLNQKHLNNFNHTVGRVDYIHAQATYPAAIIAHELHKTYGIPYFVTIRMSPFPFLEFLLPNGDLKPSIRQPLERARGLIATSFSLKERLEQFGFNNVKVIHNPVDMDFFKPDFSLPNEKDSFKTPTILTVGRMVPQKGIDLLIYAIAKLEDQFSAKFRIIGDGNYRKKYVNLAKSLCIEHRITWTGELSREQVRNEMQKCSYYLLPSRHETFGNVLLESMACGKPVLASNCGGPKDIVTQEVGKLYENQNVDALLQAIRSFDPLTYSSTTIHKITKERFGIRKFSYELKKFFTTLK